MVTQGCTQEQAAGLVRQAAGQEAKTILEIAHSIIHQHNNSRQAAAQQLGWLPFPGA